MLPSTLSLWFFSSSPLLLFPCLLLPLLCPIGKKIGFLSRKSTLSIDPFSSCCWVLICHRLSFHNHLYQQFLHHHSLSCSPPPKFSFSPDTFSRNSLRIFLTFLLSSKCFRKISSLSSFGREAAVVRGPGWEPGAPGWWWWQCHWVTTRPSAPHSPSLPS